MKALKCFFAINVLLFIFCSAASAQDYIFAYKDEVYEQGLVMPMSAEFNQRQLMGSIYLTDDEEALKRMLDAGLIEGYGPDEEVVLLDFADDPRFHSQENYEFKLTNAAGLVNNGRWNGSGVKVGIIDTGIAMEHGDINYNKIVARRNVLKNSSDPLAADVTDEQGHGTAVAGLIAAKTNNGLGVSSLAPEAELVIIKAFGSSTTTVSVLIDGIDYALDQGCDVLNMSVGSKPSGNPGNVYELMRKAISEAQEKGMIVVAAAGNYSNGETNNRNEDSDYMYPASYDNVVGVSSIDSNGNPSSFSYHNDKVNIAACGGSVSVLDWKNPNGVMGGSGTSFSAPFVTSVAALAKQIDPSIDQARFMELLAATADDAGAPGYDTFYGSGIINVGRLVETLLRQTGRSDKNNIELGEPTYDPYTLTYSFKITNKGFDSVAVLDTWYQKMGGDRYNSQISTVEVAPRSSEEVTYESFLDVAHMVWKKETLEPLCPVWEHSPPLD